MNKILLSIIAMCIAFASGLFYGRGQKEVVIPEKIVTKEGKTQVIYRDRTITVTKETKPDGTTTETTRTEEKDKTVDKQKSENKADTSTVSTSRESRYSLGVDTRIDPTAIGRTSPVYSGRAGIRVIGPAWGEMGFTPSTNEINLGLRLEF